MREIASIPAVTSEQSAALASPLRMEILGLFAYAEQLSIADMAECMGVRAVSLYHHVGVLEEVGLVRRAGSRRKGKRDEALFEPVQAAMEVALETDSEESGEHARRTVAAALRMAERDFTHALGRDDLVTEGEARNLIATRAHFRASPRTLSRINKHIDAILELLIREGARSTKRSGPADEGEHLSLTLALLPLKGRRPRKHENRRSPR